MIAFPKHECGCPVCDCCEMIYPTEMVITFEPCDCDECDGCGGGDVTITPL